MVVRWQERYIGSSDTTISPGCVIISRNIFSESSSSKVDTEETANSDKKQTVARMPVSTVHLEDVIVELEVADVG